jgi:hypothetical protein
MTEDEGISVGADLENVFASVGRGMFVEDANDFINDLSIWAFPASNGGLSMTEFRTPEKLPSYAFNG